MMMNNMSIGSVGVGDENGCSRMILVAASGECCRQVK